MGRGLGYPVGALPCLRRHPLAKGLVAVEPGALVLHRADGLRVVLGGAGAEEGAGGSAPPAGQTAQRSGQAPRYG